MPALVRPVRVALLNDYEIVVTGVAALLEPYAERVVVVELDSRLLPTAEVDVVLYDTFGRPQVDTPELDELRQATGAKVVVYSENVDPVVVAKTLQRGAAGYLAKSADGAEMVAVLERVRAGEVVAPDRAEPEAASGGDWPGRAHGLTAREAEVLALITQGLANQEIADRCYLSINSVKTYIRTAYRKMGVTRRSQAVLWGIDHGFEPDRFRRRTE